MQENPSQNPGLSLETPEVLAKRVQGVAPATPSVMDNLKVAQASGDPVAVEAATKAADEEYMLPGNKPSEVERSTPASLGKNSPDFMTIENQTRAKAQAAYVMGDMKGFKDAYTEMIENKIAQDEITIARYQNGNPAELYKGTNLGGTSEDYQKYHAADMVKSAQEHIAQLREHSIKQVQEKPEDVAARDRFVTKQDPSGAELGYLVIKAFKEAEDLLAKEKQGGRGKGSMYSNPEAEVASLIESALKYKSQKAIDFIKSRFTNVAGMPNPTSITLPPALQEEINKL